MILSDRDLKAELESGRLVIEPLGPNAVQPSSVDLHVGNQFRVFANTRYPYIDVRKPMEDLTELVEVGGDEPFILHPGEFVLGTTLERVHLPDDLVGRLDGKSSLGRLGLLIHSSLPASEEILFLSDRGTLAWTPIGDVVRKSMSGAVVGFHPETFEVGYHRLTGWYEGPPDVIYEIRLASGRSVRVTAGHNVFTIDQEGLLAKVRTGALAPGTMVAVPRRIPDPSRNNPEIAVLGEIPESEWSRLMARGDVVREYLAANPRLAASLLADFPISHSAFYRRKGQLPLAVVAQEPAFLEAVNTDGFLAFEGKESSLPAALPVSDDLAWLLGLYLAEGTARANQVHFANTDPEILHRVEKILTNLELSPSRSEGGVVARSGIFSLLIRHLGFGEGSRSKRIPSVVWGWPQPLLEAFFRGYADGGGPNDPGRVSRETSSDKLAGDLILLGVRLGGTSAACREHKLIGGDLAWDRVVEVVRCPAEPIYDISVQPSGENVQNFLAGQGGTFVANTAGFVDPGFRGHLTLEFSNVANLPITLYPGMKIGQLSLFKTTSPAENPYGSGPLGSKYLDQEGPTPSRYWENFPSEEPESSA